MTFGEKLKEYRLQHDLTQEQLATIIGTSKQVISRYENDQRSPKLSVASKFAELLGINMNSLIDDKNTILEVTSELSSDFSDIPPGFLPPPKMQRVPVIGYIACGTPIMAEENYDGYVEAPEDRQIDFALVCRGDSMIDEGIQDGDAVYIRRQQEVRNGQIAAVRIGDEATLKRIYRVGDTVTLQAANRNYDPMIYSGEELNEIFVEGVMVGYTHWLRNSK